MKRFVIDLLICPHCLPEEIPLLCHISEQHGDEIQAGVFECEKCNTQYPIEDGIANLMPPNSKPLSSDASRYETLGLVSSYLWSQYSDLFSDPDSTDAYARWAVQVIPGSGAALDIGCAVGRFTFELARKLDTSIGLDTSQPFIRAARELMISRRIDVSFKVEGYISKPQTIFLPKDLDTEYVDFIVADALALPFPGSFFSAVTSLNLVDKVPKPALHLEEINRVAKKEKAQLLLSDPYSWSDGAADESEWLGGVRKGKYKGRGFENVASILSNEIDAPWRIKNKGEIWWKIRNHSNHFELIRSLFIKAGR